MSRESASRFAATGLALLVGGCTAVLAPGNQPTDGEATLQVRADIRTPGGYTAQAVVLPYASSDIDHVRVKLFVVSNNTESQAKTSSNVAIDATVASGSLSAPLTFSKLKVSTTYRVRAYAYKAAAETDGNKISADTSSYVDVAVTNDDRPAMAAVPVQLVDKSFAGLATTSLTVTEGILATPGPETVVFPTPTPAS